MRVARSRAPPGMSSVSLQRHRKHMCLLEPADSHITLPNRKRGRREQVEEDRVDLSKGMSSAESCAIIPHYPERGTEA